MKQLLCCSHTGSFNSFLQLPINIIFSLSVVYGIMGEACLYVCTNVCISLSMYVLCMHVHVFLLSMHVSYRHNVHACITHTYMMYVFNETVIKLHFNFLML